MSSGEFGGVRFHPVTGERSARTRALATRLLQADGQDPAMWIVRVLETDPKVINAFVGGGKYIYVYAGLLAQNPSEDELAFILGHVLGHALLEHQERRGIHGPTSLSAVAGLTALVSVEHGDARKGGAVAMAGSFDRDAEQEADAIGTCIARRAGFDPLLGADYFRKHRLEHDARLKERDGRLAQARGEVDRAQSACERVHEEWKNAPREQAQTIGTQASAICADARYKLESYNRLAGAYMTGLSHEPLDFLLGAHAQDPSRMAAIAALFDCLGGRRDTATLTDHERSRCVLVALQPAGSVLVSPVTPETVGSPGRDSSAVAPKNTSHE